MIVLFGMNYTTADRPRLGVNMQDYNAVDDVYLANQHHCWPSHIAHFHTTFTEYKNCPQTCPEEIEEFVNKVRGENKCLSDIYNQ
jgi:hypothetical protein